LIYTSYIKYERADIMAIHVGTAPDSWGVWFPKNDRQPPWRRCLDEMSRAEYEGVELGPWGYLPNEAEILRAELEKRNLKLVAGTISGNFADDGATDAMRRTIEEMSALLLRFPFAKYVVMIQDRYTDEETGDFILPRMLTGEERKRLYANLQRTGDFVRGFGLIPALHPHVECYIETEAEIEDMLGNTDIPLCFDTGHHLYSGGDPVAFCKKHFDRIPYLHIKECDAEILRQARINKWTFPHAVAEGVMCEPGSGDIDFAELFGFMKQKNYDGWVVTEQDMYPLTDMNRPFEVADRTRKYLRSIGI